MSRGQLGEWQTLWVLLKAALESLMSSYWIKLRGQGRCGRGVEFVRIRWCEKESLKAVAEGGYSPSLPLQPYHSINQQCSVVGNHSRTSLPPTAADCSTFPPPSLTLLCGHLPPSQVDKALLPLRCSSQSSRLGSLSSQSSSLSQSSAQVSSPSPSLLMRTSSAGRAAFAASDHRSD